MKARLCLFIMIFATVVSLQVRATPVDILVTVNGTNRIIGGLDATTEGARIIGTFTLNNIGAALDAKYDFQWVNVETKYIVNGTQQGSDPLLGNLPAIDPAPYPFNPSEDNVPYYYNAGEWASGVFGGINIHQEGTASRFVDRPRDGTNNSLIDFTTYLVVDVLHAPSFPNPTFPLIGWFDWEYNNNGNFVNGVSTLGTVSSVVGQSDVDLVNGAIARAKPNGFGTWNAVANVNILPEPGTVILFLTGLFLLSTVGNCRTHQSVRNAPAIQLS